MAEEILRSIASKYSPEPPRHYRMLVVGIQDSGKTEFVRKLFDGADIIGIDPFGKFGQPITSSTEAMLVLGRLREGTTIIIDEWPRYAEDENFVNVIKKLYEEHKHYGIDIVLMARKITQFPATIADMASHYVVFASPGVNDRAYLESVAHGLGDEAQSLAPYECIVVDSQRRFSRLPRIRRVSREETELYTSKQVEVPSKRRSIDKETVDALLELVKGTG